MLFLTKSTLKKNAFKFAIVGVSLIASVTALLIFGTLNNDKPALISSADGIAPTITPNTRNVSTGGSISIAFGTSESLVAGNLIQFSYPSGYTGTLSTTNTTINGVAPSLVANATSGGRTTSTLTIANPSIAATSVVTIATTALTTPASAGNYSFIITTPFDSGANIQYVGEANVVLVTAFVPVSLSFDIRNSADTANTNVCDLGTASTTTVSTCSYRLKVSTNATSGYTVFMQANGELTNGSYNMENAVAGPTGTNIVAGTERYGATISAGSVTSVGGTATVGSIFSGSNSVLYNYSTPQSLYVVNKPNNPAASGDTTNTALVTHRLAISSNTGAGSYTQKITYTVTPSF